MKHTAFKTNPISLEELLRYCGTGKIQLPDFQRSWVWDEDRIKSLIASISQAFPVGALMTLEMKSGAADTFARRLVQGVPPEAAGQAPEQLLLDGQQRMTSLYQTCMRREVVETITPRLKLVKRWFYINIQAALQPDTDREEAIIGVPEDRIIKSDFDRKVVLDLSTPELEYEKLMFPLNQAFEWDAWQEGFGDYWIAKGDIGKREIFKAFKNEVLQSFKGYQVPVIALAPETSHAAVCLVFEKVNTGGKPLDAFELVTAMYAAQGFRLRDDWLGADGQPGMQHRLQVFGRAADQKFGVLEKVASTDVLQAISLLHTAKLREDAVAAGKKDNDLPAVRATRQSLLDIPLSAYEEYRTAVEEGFKTAAKLLRQHHVFRVNDLPYQGQLVPLAAILAKIGDKWQHAAAKQKLARWYWCGIFGELYGSSSESRFAKDILEVPAWIDGGPEPSTVREGVFRAERLRFMRTRQSAAYKGVHALLMGEGAIDFRSGQAFGQTIFFDENVDIHHIFPQDWCRKKGHDVRVFDTIINKTPLGYRTNRTIGGAAPSDYLAKLEAGGKDAQAIAPVTLDDYLRTHAVDPALLRADAFDAFMADRETRLLALISAATGHKISRGGAAPEEGEDVIENALEANLGTTASAEMESA
ncbi:MAG: DUF262 domain-containing protein [Roseomonas sp.]|nr:DUF262 domain-containing protein [Roseomonas sp.]MCA3582476.1 DUF262 domain-containing protein [Methylocystis sp.]MCA3386457.1 DUF262 domain-containing protein [Roseomonas sp.]MCA3394749.1 DUF262 domain-containing protein [Roseomonas sp.]MCA3401427.1 DUF262 domain-containing protein [Roseomonas sp.]